MFRCHLIKAAMITAALTAAAPAATTYTIFSDSFESPTVDTTAFNQHPVGWTYVDILTAGDHSALGLVLEGTSSGGKLVAAAEDGDQFLFGGRSTDYATQVIASMTPNHIYTLTVWSRSAGSSFHTSRIYMTSTLQDSAESATKLTGTTVTTNSGDTWTQFTSTFTATLADAGNPLYINLESRRDVSTAIVGWDNVVVTVTVPAPAALPAGLAMFGGLLMRRRRIRR